jgi:predicted GIY-YIG superfamily endonuclease
MTDGAYLYILRCADGSYYNGTTRTELEIRIAQHNAGTFAGSTSARRPVTLVYSQWFDRITDAIECSRNGAGPRRQRSCAATSRNSRGCPSASRLILRDARLWRAPQDEDWLRGDIVDPHGEERRLRRVRTMLRIAGRTMRPSR